mgnify:CR=1 FL=1
MAIAKTSKPAARSKRTKVEVQREFAQLRSEVESAAEEMDEKAKMLAATKDAATRSEVEGLTVEHLVERISGLSLEVGRALANLGEQLNQEVNRLAALREAVELERKELERLHKIDIAATALDQLIQDYAREKDRLENEIASQRRAWEEELRAGERERKEQEEALKKQRQREAEEYEYKKSLERKKAQDKYEEELRLREKSNQERQEALEKSWQARESELKAKEEEHERLAKEVAEFGARLQKETELAASRAASGAEAKYQQQLQLLKKDAESEKRLAELRIQALEETVKRQTSMIETLQKQLEEAKQQVQEIAVRAIEGASGAKALAHVGQIAMEQARTRSPKE